MERSDRAGRVVVDEQGRVASADDEFLALTDRAAGTVEGQPFLTLLAPGSQVFWLAHLGTSPRGVTTDLSLDLVDAGGSRVAVEATVTPVSDADGRDLMGVTVRTRDGRPADERRVAELVREAQLTTTMARATLAAIPDAVAVTDDAGRVTAWNRATEVLLGVEADAVVGTELASLLAGGDPERRAALAARLATAVAPGTQLDVVRADGAIVTVTVSVGVADAGSDRVHVVHLRDGSGLGLPPRGAAPVPSPAAPGPAARGLPAPGPADQGPAVVVVGVDATGRYDLAESSGEPLGEDPLSGLLGRSIHEVLADRPASLSRLTAALTEGRTDRYLTRFAGRDWQVVVRPRVDVSGTRTGATLVATDVSALTELQREAHRAVTTDPLTGLLNREGLLEAIEAEVAAARAGGGRVALVQLDVDDFTAVNDSLGHRAGDAVLAELARRLVTVSPRGTIVARHGGDAFTLVLGPQVPDQPELLARRVVSALSAPVILTTGEGNPGPESVVVAVTAGISRQGDDSGDAAQLLLHADAALREARAQARPVATYDARAHNASDRFRLVRRLRLALANGDLDVQYQPVLSVRGPWKRSVEALVRWTDAELGPVRPDELVAAAESARLIDDVGAVVIDRACAQLAAWDAAGVEVARVAVNASPLQLDSGRLLPALESAVARNGLTFDRLTVEVTESTVAALGDRALRVLHRLRDRGALVALDDFGTGQSSLAHLRDLPVDVIKLDRSFIAGLPEPVPAALVAAFVGVASALGLTTVAEGVETVEQDAAVRVTGCTHGQGYLYGRPVPGADIV